MSKHTENLLLKNTENLLLKIWNDAIDANRAANSQIAAAASLFIAGKVDRAELERFSAKADAAELTRNAAERAYRDSYRAA